MSLTKAMDILSSGLHAQRRRMEVASTNLANAHTTRTADGGPYAKQNVILTAQDIGGSDDASFSATLKRVSVDGTAPDSAPFPEVYDPGHPDANKETGMVQMPNVNVMEEMVDMITASRSFEANVTAFEALKAMVNKAMEIGR